MKHLAVFFVLFTTFLNAQNRIEFLDNTYLNSDEILAGKNTFQPTPTLTAIKLKKVLNVKTSTEIIGGIFRADNHEKVRPFISLIDNNLTVIDSINLPYYVTNGIQLLDTRFPDDEAYGKFRESVILNQADFPNLKKLLDNSWANRQNKKYILALKATVFDTTANIAINKRDVVLKQLKADLVAKLKAQISKVLGNVDVTASIDRVMNQEIQFDARLFYVRLTPTYEAYLNAKLCTRYKSKKYLRYDLDIPAYKALSDYFKSANYGMVFSCYVLEAKYSIKKDVDVSKSLTAAIAVDNNISDKDKKVQLEVQIGLALNVKKDSEQNVDSAKSLYILGYADSDQLDIGEAGQTRCN